MKRPDSRFDLVIASLIAVASLLLYLRTLAPDVVDADGAEFQFAAWNFSFVHPTGYPLYLILGGLFQHLVPIGNPALRLNLFTAVTAALAVAVVYLAALELTSTRAAAMVAALSFAVTQTFWFDASAAETYALNALFLALLLLVAIKWQAAPSTRWLRLFCLVLGLALTHHRVVVLWIPAFVLFFGWVSWKKHLDFSKTELVGSLLLLLLPLLLYMYIPLRAATSPYAVLRLTESEEIVLYDNTPSGLWDYMLGRSFEGELGWDGVSQARLLSFPVLLQDEYTLLGIGLGLVGLCGMLFKRERERLTLLVAGFVATVLFAAAYHIGDYAHYYVPAYLAWALFVGAGIAEISGAVQSLLQRGSYRSIREGASEPGVSPVVQDGDRDAGEAIPDAELEIASSQCLRKAEARPLLAMTQTQQSSAPPTVAVGSRAGTVFMVVVLVLAFPLLGLQLWSNFPVADRSGEMRAREQWSRVLAASIPQDSILLSNDRDEMMPLWYIQYVENTRRDLLGLFPRITAQPEHANIVRLTDAVLDSGRPVYYIKSMPGIQVKYRVEQAEPPLERVLGAVADIRPQSVADVTLADRARIVGYDAAQDRDKLTVAVYWQLRSKLDHDYTTFVHLIDARGQKVAQGTDHLVGGAFYPTSLWLVGETLRDEQVVPLSQVARPGEYRLVVGMYRQPDLEPLGEPVEIGSVRLGDNEAR